MVCVSPNGDPSPPPRQPQVNFILAGLDKWKAALLQSARGSPLEAAEGWTALNRSLVRRLAEMADIQARAIFWETTCDCIVYKSELWELRQDANYVELLPEDALKRCANRSTAPYYLGGRDLAG